MGIIAAIKQLRNVMYGLNTPSDEQKVSSIKASRVSAMGCVPF
jgi:hypothetical protein